ncbi:PREDICTED: uncharacterized protein C1orf189 homolog isoform X2 [Ficedula albicollis]|uniref:uncharacterized protein C1orf189 homolog isoform X2 n=1 Tax=Ficedula albicollis TaxID=59894 RepID=UPI00035949AE|nr:PREDICTED: uncharacterized protein C1orf189 homolog isoform X2 [Ficedula albicollis]
MAVPNSQSSSLQQEVRHGRSWEGGSCPGSSSREHPKCWTASLGVLRCLMEPWLKRRVDLELHLAGREQALIRRDALCQLVLDEHLQHQQELRQQGKAFYVERL